MRLPGAASQRLASLLRCGSRIVRAASGTITFACEPAFLKESITVTLRVREVEKDVVPPCCDFAVRQGNGSARVRGASSVNGKIESFRHRELVVGGIVNQRGNGIFACNLAHFAIRNFPFAVRARRARRRHVDY